MTDSNNCKIRRVEVATGAVTTVAGSGITGSADGVGDAARFDFPIGIAISQDGSALFVADYENHKIRRVEVATGAVKKGLLGDALDQVAELKGAMRALRVAKD